MDWTVFITEQMWDKANEIAEIRARNKHGVLASSRPLSDGYEELGVIGEIGLANKLHLSIDTTRRMSGDAGIDLWFRGYSIDVKCHRNAYNLVVEQGKVKADIHVQSRFYPDRIEHLGWAFQNEVLNAPVRDFGYGIPDHYIPACKLRPMDNLFKLTPKNNQPETIQQTLTHFAPRNSF